MSGKRRLVDIYPNHMDISITQPSTDGFVEGQLATGLEAISPAGLMQDNKTTPNEMVCFELLGIYAVEPTIDGDGQHVFWSVDTVTGTAPSSLATHGHIIGRDSRQNGAAGERLEVRQIYVDLTLGGLGFLLASPKLYVRFDTNNMASAHTMHFRIYYRYVRISFFEFYQMQQSQLMQS